CAAHRITPVYQHEPLAASPLQDWKACPTPQVLRICKQWHKMIYLTMIFPQEEKRVLDVPRRQEYAEKTASAGPHSRFSAKPGIGICCERAECLRALPTKQRRQSGTLWRPGSGTYLRQNAARYI